MTTPRPGRIHNVATTEVAALLGSVDGGLTDAEAARRLRELGLNVLSEPPSGLWLRNLARQLTNFFTLLLFAAAGICFFALAASQDAQMGVMGWALAAVALINAAFSFIQEYRAERAMQALQAFLPEEVTVLRSGREQRLAATQLVPGDVVLLSEGDRISADARVIESHDLLLNNAPLTGESAAVHIVAEQSAEGRLLDANNVALAGCSVVRGSGRAVVFATGARTLFGRIATLSAEVPRTPSPLERETARMVRVLTLIAVGMGLSFFIYGLATGRPLLVNLVFMMGIIVANVPEGLLPTFTLALAMGSMRMARRNVLVKSLSAVETLGSVQIICTDKTGTLTRNALRLTGIVAPGAPDKPAKGARALEQEAARALLTDAYLASDVRFADGQPAGGDPLDVEVARALMEHGGDCALIDAARHEHYSFDVALRRAAGRSAQRFAVKGAWSTLRPMIAQVAGAPASAAALAQADEVSSSLSRAGKRIIAVAGRPLPDAAAGASAVARETVEQDLELLGFLCFEDALRPEVPAAMARAHSAGIGVLMITGDDPETATEIARQAGIVAPDAQAQDVALTGQRLAGMTRAELGAALLGPVCVVARTSPEQKMRIVQALQALGKVVAMTGDGVNDAPALRAADLGIAMGAQGTDVAREAAQIVLLDDNFASIIAGVEEGRTVFANIQKFTNYVLVSNGPEILPYLLTMLLPVPLALTVIQILSIDLGTDIVPSMALGQEPPEPTVMQQPPRPRGEHLLRFGLIAHSYFFLGLLEALVSIGLFFLVMHEGGWRMGDAIPATTDPTYRSATGIALSTILLMQIGNLIGRRSSTRSGLDRGLLRNRLLAAGIVVQVVFSWAVLYWPPVQHVLATGPVRPEIYLMAWLGAPFIFGADWLRKRLARGGPGGQLTTRRLP